MIVSQKQPQLYQKYHKAVVDVLTVNWKDGEVESILVRYPEERFNSKKAYYYADTERDFSFNYDGGNVFEEVEEITVELVREFLDQASTKFGMMDSKKALKQTNGDFKKAEMILFEKERISRMSSLITKRKCE